MVCVHARWSELEKMGASALNKLVLAQMNRIEHLELMVAVAFNVHTKFLSGLLNVEFGIALNSLREAVVAFDRRVLLQQPRMNPS